MRLLVFFLAISLSFFAVAQEEVTDSIPVKPVTNPIISQNSTYIHKIEQYLNGLTTFIAPFSQEDSEGGKTSGTFYLSRPGRLRWEYSPPTPVLIVAKGSLVAYYDKELDELSHVSIDDTLAGFLTRSKISFNDDGVKVTNFEKKNGKTQITISQHKKEEQGNLTMIFKDSTMDLLQMEVIDSVGKRTIVRFNTPVYNKPIEKDLFAFPRTKPRNRR